MGLFFLKNQSMAVKIFVNGIIISTLLVGAMVYKSQVSLNHVMEKHDRAMAEVGVDAVKRRMTVSYQFMQIAIGQMLANEDLIQAFARQDRAEVARITGQMKAHLNAVNIDVVHFHLPDSTTFYRVHNPEKFGDDLSFRKMITDINTQRRKITGLEEGIHGLALRHIEPVFVGDSYIGAIEVGMFFDEQLLNLFKRVNGGEWHLCAIDKDLSKKLASTDPNSLCYCNSEDIPKLKNKETLFMKRDHNLVQLIPLEDYDGEVYWFLSRVYDNSAQIAFYKKERFNGIAFGIGLSLAGFLIVFFLTRYSLQPLSYLVEKTKAFTNGDFSEHINIKTQDEIGQLAQTMEVMRRSLIHLAYHDSLTDLPNRKLLVERFEQEIARAKRNDERLGVLFLDLDDFKYVNDTLGHNAGDKLLQEVARRLRETLRGSDAIFRVGGDEFIILLPQIRDEGNVEMVMKKILHAFADPAIVDGNEVSLHVSLGASIFPIDGEIPETLIKIADEAMYRVKKTGENDDKIRAK